MRPSFLVAALLGVSAHAESFRNLGFDEANTNNVNILPLSASGFIPAEGLTTDLSPGWLLLAYQRNSGFREISRIGLNAPGNRFLRDPSSILSDPWVFPHIEGKFAFMLAAPANGPDYELFQVGEVPADAKYLTFKTSAFYRPDVAMGGRGLQAISNLENQSEPQSIYFDISEFAGWTTSLTFAIRPYEGSPQTRFGYLDSIRFTSVIPEPGTALILGLGGVWLVLDRYRRKSSSANHK